MKEPPQVHRHRGSPRLAGGGAAAALGERLRRGGLHLPTTRLAAPAPSSRAASTRPVPGKVNDSVARFMSTVKGSSFRGREADAWRLAEESVRVIDHMNAIGAPFAREYGGRLATRCGGVQVSRTYARGRARWQAAGGRRPGAAAAGLHGAGQPAHPAEMLDLIVADGRAQASSSNIIAERSPRSPRATPSVLATVATATSTAPRWPGLKRDGHVPARRRGRCSPTRASSSSAHGTSRLQRVAVHKAADPRVPAQRRPRLGCPCSPGTSARPTTCPRKQARLLLERRYPAFGNLTPGDIASRAARPRSTRAALGP
ncbi:hypothetical protein QJS66_21385 [Kocuria rhizophila]|nr:hypothetical protein QJS66_21385 [Kocuria rhizophila]